MPGPALHFERIDSLKLYDKNARTHSPDQIAELKRSMTTFGWTMPVLRDAQGVVAGHARIRSATELYAEGETITLPDGTPIPEGCVPVLRCDGWPDDKRRAYILADNRLAMNAGWDDDVLRGEITDLQALDFDLTLLGFPSDELDIILTGWSSDIDHSHGGSAGGADNALDSVVRVVVKPEVKDSTIGAIKYALENAGIAYELK